MPEPNQQQQIDPSQTDNLLSSGQPAGSGSSASAPEGQPAGSGSSDPTKPEIPEKFRQQDGTLNQEALLKSYGELEKRFGAGEAPPKSADEYKLDYKLPEGVTIDKEAEKSFLASCHSQGMSNKQVQFVMDKYAGILGEQVKGATTTKEQAETSLKTSWGDKYGENIGLAQKAFNALVDEADRNDKAAINQLGNNPVFLRMLAKAGANLKEDNPPAGGMPTGTTEEEIQTVMRSEAYWKATHPEHQSVKAKVEAFHKAKFAKRAS